MTERPYTDNDLRAEAARQYRTATQDPDFPETTESMEGHNIPSRGDVQWDQLDDSDFYKAQRTVDTLLDKAADLAEWAVDLGADGLEPLDASLAMATNTGPLVRIHFAVRPDMPEDMRTALVEGVGMEIAKYLPQYT
jgi:hypothetical protein